MERREITALARVLTVQVRETIAAELRGLRDQVQEVKTYVDQRIREITPPLQVEGRPGKDAEVDYVLVAAQIQAEVERRLESSLKAALAEIPTPRDGLDADPELVKAMVLAEIPKPRDGRDAEPVRPDVLVAMVRAAVDEIPLPRDGKDADMELVFSRIDSQVKDAVAALPPPKDGLPGKDGESVELATIEALVLKTVAALPPAKDGADGKDAPPIDQAFIVAEVLRQIPIPKNGKDGESVDPEIIKEMVIAEARRAVASIPPPKDGVDGKDAPAIDVEALIEEVTKRIPVPKDGRSVEPQEVKAMVAEAVAALPPPKDGRDAEPIHPDSIRLMVVEEVAKMPKPKDGNDGRSSLSLDFLPTIDPAQSYPRGTEATYRGGTIKAIRNTSPIGDGTLEQAGWSILANGFDCDAAELKQGEDPRAVEWTVPFTSGRSLELKAFFPVPIYREVWRNGVEDYRRGEAVTKDGSVWICLKDGTATQPGMPNADWRLIVKRGAEGKPGQKGEDGKDGKHGRDGRDLTQMDSSGKKW